MPLTQREAQPPRAHRPQVAPVQICAKVVTPPLLARAGHCAARLPTMFRFFLSFLIGKFIGDFIFGTLLRSKLLRRLTAVAIIGTYVWAKYL